MRSKEQILDDSLRMQSRTPQRDLTTSLHEQLTIEVLIDIRDHVSTMINVIISLREHLQGNI